MASIESCVLAALVHLIFRYALYITPQSRLQTPGPVTPTVIISIVVLNIIYESRMVPTRFEEMSVAFKYLFELTMAIIFLEVSMAIWQSIEHSIYLIAMSALIGLEAISKKTYLENETIIIGTFTLPLSLAILYTTMQTTERLTRLYLYFE